MLIKLIQFLISILREEQVRARWRGMYVNNDYPKTYGTRIKR